jgi:hypothetical protein
MADNFARMFGLGKDQLDIARRRKGGSQPKQP